MFARGLQRFGSYSNRLWGLARFKSQIELQTEPFNQRLNGSVRFWAFLLVASRFFNMKESAQLVKVRKTVVQTARSCEHTTPRISWEVYYFGSRVVESGMNLASQQRSRHNTICMKNRFWPHKILVSVLPAHFLHRLLQVAQVAWLERLPKLVCWRSAFRSRLENIVVSCFLNIWVLFTANVHHNFSGWRSSDQSKLSKDLKDRFERCFVNLFVRKNCPN